MNQITLRPLALIALASLSLVVSANASSSMNNDRYIHPNLPAGKILLIGTATIVLNHCAMMGVGAPAGDHTGPYGTTILLTSELCLRFNSKQAGRFPASTFIGRIKRRGGRLTHRCSAMAVRPGDSNTALSITS
jgi:hypothetical protein